jgi:hypothetical protein
VKRFLSLWFVLASSAFVGSLLLDRFTSIPITLRSSTLTVLVLVTLAQSALLHFLRSTSHENPDQHG